MKKYLPFITIGLVLLAIGCRSPNRCCPDQVGPSYLKQLRKQARGDSPPVVFQVSHANGEDSSAASNIARSSENSEGKKIVLFLDGTGNTPDSKTNIWKLYQLAEIEKSNHPEQPRVLKYVEGVGTHFGSIVTGSAFGFGLGKRIRSAYLFLVNHYEPGDQIFLFGFSRGAFIARSLNGFIEHAGLIQKTPSMKFQDLKWATNRLYHLYTQKNDGLPRFAQRLKADIACRAQDLPIYRGDDKGVVTAIGVFDTVPALGVDRDDNPDNHRTNLYAENGIHAMAIDEQRDDFRLLRFDPRIQDRQRLKEVWFAGVHSDIGGGYDCEDGLATLSRDWMLDQFSGFGLFPDKEDRPKSDLRIPLNAATMHDPFLKSRFYQRLGISWRRPHKNDFLHVSVFDRVSLKGQLLRPHLRETDRTYSPGNLFFPLETHYQVEPSP